MMEQMIQLMERQVQLSEQIDKKMDTLNKSLTTVVKELGIGTLAMSNFVSAHADINDKQQEAQGDILSTMTLVVDKVITDSGLLKFNKNISKS